MSDHNPDTSHHRSALDRARGDRRLFPVRGQAWDDGMQQAREARRVRTAVAASRAVALARELAGQLPGEYLPEEVMWELRGEPRTRATFGLPHPGDYPGGLPLPPG